MKSSIAGNYLRLLALMLIQVASVPFYVYGQSNWPQFRGEDARGIASDEAIADQWSVAQEGTDASGGELGKNIAWKRDIAGRGWSSPIVWGDKVFLTTVVNQGESEEPKKGLYFGGDRPKPADSIHLWKAICLDLNSGSVLWEKELHQGKPQSAIHLKSSYAAETPSTDGKQVYCYFGNLGLFCLDFDGNVVWEKQFPPCKTRYGWGTAASPILHDGRLYLVNDNEEDSYLLALDTRDGSEIWRTSRDEKSNWATPYLWKNKERTEIVTPGTGKVRSYDLDGKLLWSLVGMSSITIATPYEADGLLYVSSGYVMDSRRPIYAIRPGAQGDISLSKGETSNQFIAWSQPKSAPYNPTTLVQQQRLYVLYDRSQIACFHSQTGEEIFPVQRIKNGGAFTASPWASKDKIFCLNEDGVTFVFQAGDEYKLLHTNSLAADDMCMATPAIAGKKLLIRTSARIYCIQSND